MAIYAHRTLSADELKEEFEFLDFYYPFEVYDWLADCLDEELDVEKINSHIVKLDFSKFSKRYNSFKDFVEDLKEKNKVMHEDYENEIIWIYD